MLGALHDAGVGRFQEWLLLKSSQLFPPLIETEEDVGLEKRKRDLLGSDEGFPGCENTKANVIFGMGSLQET